MNILFPLILQFLVLIDARPAPVNSTSLEPNVQTSSIPIEPLSTAISSSSSLQAALTELPVSTEPARQTVDNRTQSVAPNGTGRVAAAARPQPAQSAPSARPSAPQVPTSRKVVQIARQEVSGSSNPSGGISRQAGSSTSGTPGASGAGTVASGDQTRSGPFGVSNSDIELNNKAQRSADTGKAPSTQSVVLTDSNAVKQPSSDNSSSDSANQASGPAHIIPIAIVFACIVAISMLAYLNRNKLINVWNSKLKPKQEPAQSFARSLARSPVQQPVRKSSSSMAPFTAPQQAVPAQSVFSIPAISSHNVFANHPVQAEPAVTSNRQTAVTDNSERISYAEYYQYSTMGSKRIQSAIQGSVDDIEARAIALAASEAASVDQSASIITDSLYEPFVNTNRTLSSFGPVSK